MKDIINSETVEEMLANTAIVLMQPKYPENIGAAARSAFNMGISRIIVVGNEAPDREKMLKTATHNAAHLIESIKLYEALADALAPFSYVVGTTARHGRHRVSLKTPKDIVFDLIPLLKNNQIALLFGPEQSGLTNDDLKYCNTLTTIPTLGFSSMNLAQAVAIHCYELFCGLQQAADNGRLNHPAPKLAVSLELENMYQHVEQVLYKIGFLKAPDYDYWMRSVRRFLGRLELRAKEVRIVRGLCRQFIWYDSQFHKGKKEGD